MKVGILLARRSAERAEPTPDETHVCEIDISIDDVGDHVADTLAPDKVGCKDQRFKFGAGCSREAQPVLEPELFTINRSIENLGDDRINRRQQSFKNRRFVRLKSDRRAHLNSPTRSRPSFSNE